MADQLPKPLDVIRAWQGALAKRDMGTMAEVVDMAGYREICLGLTDWTTGYDVALANWMKNMVQPWSDMHFSEEEVVEGEDTVTLRSSIEATHVGPFLGIDPTGRRVRWDNISIVHVSDGKVVGQWAQPDLYGIYRQLIAD
jgi:predicted ester cyclase